MLVNVNNRPFCDKTRLPPPKVLLKATACMILHGFHFEDHTLDESGTASLWLLKPELLCS
jgi:hypothetical protein